MLCVICSCISQRCAWELEVERYISYNGSPNDSGKQESQVFLYCKLQYTNQLHSFLIWQVSVHKSTLHSSNSTSQVLVHKSVMIDLSVVTKSTVSKNFVHTSSPSTFSNILATKVFKIHVREKNHNYRCDVFYMNRQGGIASNSLIQAGGFLLE